MAGTIEGIALNLMVMVGMLFAAIKTGDPAFWACVCVGLVALGAHIAIMVRDRRKAERDSFHDEIK